MKRTHIPDRGENQSEVARILHDIEQAYNSAYTGLNGPAIVGPHRQRTICTEQIGAYFEELESAVGGFENAMLLISDALEHPDSEPTKSPP